MAWQSKRRRGRGPVTWKKDAETYVAPAKVSNIRRHVHTDDVPSEKLEEYAAGMNMGSMWEVVVDLELMPLQENVVKPPFPILQQHLPRKWDVNYDKLKHTIAQAGNIALYTGCVRVEEQSKTGTLRVLRHTFMVGGGNYIITDLNWVKPINDT